MAQVNVNTSEKRETMCSVVFESKCEQFNFFDHFIWSLYYLFAKNKIPCNPISYTLYGTRTEMCVPISTMVGDCMNDPLAILKMRRGNTNVERIKNKYSKTTKNHQIRVEKKCCLFLFYSPVEFGQMYLLRSVKHILYISMSDKFSPSCILNCIVFFLLMNNSGLLRRHDQKQQQKWKQQAIQKHLCASWHRCSSQMATFVNI